MAKEAANYFLWLWVNHAIGNFRQVTIMITRICRIKMSREGVVWVSQEDTDLWERPVNYRGFERTSHRTECLPESHGKTDEESAGQFHYFPGDVPAGTDADVDCDDGQPPNGDADFGNSDAVEDDYIEDTGTAVAAVGSRRMSRDNQALKVQQLNFWRDAWYLCWHRKKKKKGQRMILRSRDDDHTVVVFYCRRTWRRPLWLLLFSNSYSKLHIKT